MGETQKLQLYIKKKSAGLRQIEAESRERIQKSKDLEARLKEDLATCRRQLKDSRLREQTNTATEVWKVTEGHKVLLQGQQERHANELKGMAEKESFELDKQRQQFQETIARLKGQSKRNCSATEAINRASLLGEENELLKQKLKVMGE
jgi:hypothetical protein